MASARRRRVRDDDLETILRNRFSNFLPLLLIFFPTKRFLEGIRTDSIKILLLVDSLPLAVDYKAEILLIMLQD